MEKLIKRYRVRIKNTLVSNKRYLYQNIDWNDRLICIKGSRGVGKTTLILQYIKQNFINDETTLYISLDDIHFQVNTLIDTVEEFYLNGGKRIFIDEVHKYSNWSIEIKNIYDTFTDLKIVFTSSSLLEIHKGEADLSRRAVNYTLEGLSFREFIQLETHQNYNTLTLDQILCNHLEIAQEITSNVKIYPLFKKYLITGFYPFYLEGEASYMLKLKSVIDLTLESDIPSVYHTEFKTIYKLKKLLYIIATSLPYQTNITELSRSIETSSRNSTLLYLDYLDKGKLTANLKTSAKGKNIMVKPDKIYLENPNLMYAIGNTNLIDGNVRETFFFNQVRSKHIVNTSKQSDFLVDELYTFEIGGKGKKQKQILNIENSYIAADNIEIGFQNKIPLWLFGFLY